MPDLPRLVTLPANWLAARETVEESLRDSVLYLGTQPRTRLVQATHRGGETLRVLVRGMAREPFAVEILHAAPSSTPGTTISGLDPIPVWRWDPSGGQGQLTITTIGGLSAGVDYTLRLRITEAPA